MDNFGIALTVINVVLGGAMTMMIGSHNKRTNEIEALKEKYHDLRERTVKLESEVVTEREVRDILVELIHPMSEVLSRLDTKIDKTSADLVNIRIMLGVRKHEDSSF